MIYRFMIIAITVIINICAISIIKSTLKSREEKNSKLEKLFNKYYIIIFISILIVSLFIRIYNIDKIPKGIHVDEAGMAYDAYCIANYGIDRYLNCFPVYMINFGGGQSALYTYLAALAVKILGFNILSIRIPAFFISSLAIIFGYLLVRNNIGKKSAITFMSLMAICPWHIMQSRWGLDCNLMSSMIVISMYLLVMSKKAWQFFIAGILLGITLYSYALSYIIVPIFLVLTLIYMLYTNRINVKNIVILGIPIVLFAIPLILMLLVNNGYINEIKSYITIPKLFFYRGSEIGTSNILENIKCIKNIYTTDGLIYNAIPEFGTIYLFSIPLLILGLLVECKKIVQSIKSKKFTVNSIMMFLFIANIVCMMLTQTNINKLNSIFIPSLFFVYSALKYIYINFKIGFIINVIIFFVAFVMFLQFYFFSYNSRYNDVFLFEDNLIQVTKKLEEYEGNEIYIKSNVREAWIYTLYAKQESPYYFYNNIHKDNNNLFLGYGNYYFKLPNEIKKEDGKIYVIEDTKDNEELVTKIQESGFYRERCKNYNILFFNK